MLPTNRASRALALVFIFVMCTVHAFAGRGSSNSRFNRIAISTQSPLPSGTVGVPYSTQLYVRWGVAPYTWTVTSCSGDCNTGLSAPDANGVISGVPTNAGTSTFGIIVTDSEGNQDSTSLAITIYEATADTGGTSISGTSGTISDPLSISTTSLPQGTVNVPYSAKLAASGGNSPYKWTSASCSGDCNSGLPAPDSDGQISGTPQNSGTSDVAFMVTDSSGNTATANLSITINPDTSTSVSISPTSASLTTGGKQQFSASVSGSSNTSVTWSVNGVNGGNGSVGTISSAGLYTAPASVPSGGSVTVKATSAADTTKSASATVNVNAVAPPVAITTTSLPNGTVNVNYSATLSASGGTAPYSWSLSSGSLPAGLTLSSSGTITGKPTATGQSSFTVRVTDSASNSTQKSLAISISGSSGANKLFKGGFSNGVNLNSVSYCGSTECYQPITGTDNSTGFSWPPNVWGGAGTWNKGGFAQLIADTNISSSTIDNYVSNQLETVTGPDGNPTTALYMEVSGSDHQGNNSRQDPYIITPDVSKAQGDLYIREWIKLQPNLKSQLKSGQFSDGSWGDWRVVAEWKTGGQAMGGANACVPGAPSWGGDYRIIVFVIMDGNGNLFWRMQGDNVANGGMPYKVYWQTDNHSLPVPVGEWFKFEWFWHRSAGSDGRAWAAVNGKVIADHYGPNMGQYNCNINRIIPTTVYTGGYFPASQWVSDLEIWDGFPADATTH